MAKSKKFCGCCDLRRGSIVFAWLQMMLIVTVIAVLSGFLDISQSVANRKDNDEGYLNDSYWPIIIKVGIGAYVIKGATLVALTWGLAKRKYLFYQPWLFVSIVELAIHLFIVCFNFTALFYNIRIISLFIRSVFGAALNGYIFYCIYTVYKTDKEEKPTSVKFDEEYNSVPVELDYIIKK